MKIIRISTNSQGDGHEITETLAKHPGWKIEAVFPLWQFTTLSTIEIFLSC